MTEWSISPQERAQYDGYFAKLDTAQSGFLSGQQAASLLSKSGLPKETLSKIWNMSDMDHDGRLSQAEFRVAMHLAMRVARGSQQLPLTLPPELAQSAAAGSVGAANASLRCSRSSSVSTAASHGIDGPLPADDFGGGVDSCGAAQASSFAESQLHSPPCLSRQDSRSSAASSLAQAQVQDPWAITQHEGVQYDGYFAKLDTAQSGFLSGHQASNLLSKSGLPKETLSKIWNMSDIDNDGRLSQAEFRIAMHLAMRVARRGQQLPATLPPALSTGSGAAQSMSTAAPGGSGHRSTRSSNASVIGVTGPPAAGVGELQSKGPPPGEFAGLAVSGPAQDSEAQPVGVEVRTCSVEGEGSFGATLDAGLPDGSLGRGIMGTFGSGSAGFGTSSGFPQAGPMQPGVSTDLGQSPGSGGSGAVGQLCSASSGGAPAPLSSGDVGCSRTLPVSPSSTACVSSGPSLSSGARESVAHQASTEPPQDPWAISPQERAQYDGYFAKLDTAQSGFLSGQQAASLLSKSGLPKETLSKIWNMSDMDRDGRLSKEEFHVAMHLAMRVARGTQQLPDSLPQVLRSGGVEGRSSSLPPGSDHVLRATQPQPIPGVVRGGPLDESVFAVPTVAGASGTCNSAATEASEELTSHSGALEGTGLGDDTHGAPTPMDPSTTSQVAGFRTPDLVLAATTFPTSDPGLVPTSACPEPAGSGTGTSSAMVLGSLGATSGMSIQLGEATTSRDFIDHSNKADPDAGAQEGFARAGHGLNACTSGGHNGTYHIQPQFKDAGPSPADAQAETSKPMENNGGIDPALSVSGSVATGLSKDAAHPPISSSVEISRPVVKTGALDADLFGGDGFATGFGDDALHTASVAAPSCVESTKQVESKGALDMHSFGGEHFVPTLGGDSLRIASVAEPSSAEGTKSTENNGALDSDLFGGGSFATSFGDDAPYTAFTNTASGSGPQTSTFVQPSVEGMVQTSDASVAGKVFGADAKPGARAVVGDGFGAVAPGASTGNDDPRKDSSAASLPMEQQQQDFGFDACSQFGLGRGATSTPGSVHALNDVVDSSTRSEAQEATGPGGQAAAQSCDSALHYEPAGKQSIPLQASADAANGFGQSAIAELAAASESAQVGDSPPQVKVIDVSESQGVPNGCLDHSLLLSPGTSTKPTGLSSARGDQPVMSSPHMLPSSLGGAASASSATPSTTFHTSTVGVAANAGSVKGGDTTTTDEQPRLALTSSARPGDGEPLGWLPPLPPMKPSQTVTSYPQPESAAYIGDSKDDSADSAGACDSVLHEIIAPAHPGEAPSGTASDSLAFSDSKGDSSLGNDGAQGQLPLGKRKDEGFGQFGGDVVSAPLCADLAHCEPASHGMGNETKALQLHCAPPPTSASFGEGANAHLELSGSLASSPWHISTADATKYDLIFAQAVRARALRAGAATTAQVDIRSARLPKVTVLDLLRKSKLRQESVQSIWRLADVSSHESLDSHEFRVAMHLVTRALKGHALPESLPRELSAEVQHLRDIASSADASGASLEIRGDIASSRMSRDFLSAEVSSAQTRTSEANTDAEAVARDLQRTRRELAEEEETLHYLIAREQESSGPTKHAIDELDRLSEKLIETRDKVAQMRSAAIARAENRPAADESIAIMQAELTQLESECAELDQQGCSDIATDPASQAADLQRSIEDARTRLAAIHAVHHLRAELQAIQTDVEAAKEMTGKDDPSRTRDYLDEKLSLEKQIDGARALLHTLDAELERKHAKLQEVRDEASRLQDQVETVRTSIDAVDHDIRAAQQGSEKLLQDGQASFENDVAAARQGKASSNVPPGPGDSDVPVHKLELTGAEVSPQDSHADGWQFIAKDEGHRASEVDTFRNQDEYGSDDKGPPLALLPQLPESFSAVGEPSLGTMSVTGQGASALPPLPPQPHEPLHVGLPPARTEDVPAGLPSAQESVARDQPSNPIEREKTSASARFADAGFAGGSFGGGAVGVPSPATDRVGAEALGAHSCGGAGPAETQASADPGCHRDGTPRHCTASFTSAVLPPPPSLSPPATDAKAKQQMAETSPKPNESSGPGPRQGEAESDDRESSVSATSSVLQHRQVAAKAIFEPGAFDGAAAGDAHTQIKGEAADLADFDGSPAEGIDDDFSQEFDTSFADATFGDDADASAADFKQAFGEAPTDKSQEGTPFDSAFGADTGFGTSGFGEGSFAGTVDFASPGFETSGFGSGGATTGSQNPGADDNTSGFAGAGAAGGFGVSNGFGGEDADTFTPSGFGSGGGFGADAAPSFGFGGESGGFGGEAGAFGAGAFGGQAPTGFGTDIASDRFGAEFPATTIAAAPAADEPRSTTSDARQSGPLEPEQAVPTKAAQEPLDKEVEQKISNIRAFVGEDVDKGVIVAYLMQLNGDVEGTINAMLDAGITG